MCFHSGQSWGNMDQLWSKHKVGTSKQLQARAKKLSLVLCSLAWVQCVQRGFWTGAVCVLLLHLEGVILSAKSTLVTLKLLSWQITEPLLAGRRMRVRTQLVWVSNSVLRSHFQTVTELPDLLIHVLSCLGELCLIVMFSNSSPNKTQLKWSWAPAVQNKLLPVRCTWGDRVGMGDVKSGRKQSLGLSFCKWKSTSNPEVLVAHSCLQITFHTQQSHIWSLTIHFGLLASLAPVTGLSVQWIWGIQPCSKSSWMKMWCDTMQLAVSSSG